MQIAINWAIVRVGGGRWWHILYSHAQGKVNPLPVELAGRIVAR